MKKFNTRKSLLILIDMLTLILACFAAYFLSNTLTIVNLEPENMYWQIVNFTACNLLALGLSGAYRSIWRYANSRDFVSCILSLCVGTAASYILTVLTVEKDFRSNIYMVLAFLLSNVLIVSMRMLYQSLYLVTNRHWGKPLRDRTMIVGAGQACKTILSEMLGTDCPYYPVCIVDDSKEKISRSISGVRVYGPTARIPELCDQLQVDVILFAMPSIDEEDRKRILQICTSTGRKIKMLPYLHTMIEDQGLLNQAKEMRIEDLLGREPIQFDNSEVASFIQDEVCMVTGGGGSIGSELCRQIARYRPKLLVIVDIYENNAYEIQQELLREYHSDLNMTVQIASVRDFKKMDQLFRRFRPTVVFHAAAHKHVPLMETNPEEAVKNNIIGTFNVANLADLYRIKKFVLVSTDKAVNPTNVMGATKRCCEMIMQYMAEQSTGTEYVAVRFGNVLGSNGSVIPLFRKQIEDGGPVTVTHPDIIRYFMTIPEAVSLILQAGSMAKGGEIFVLDMGQPVKIVTLAENLIRQYGKEPYRDINIIFTGLRPGEKLFEELLMSEEGLQSTMNHKIFIGSQIPVKIDEFIDKLNAIKRVMDSDDVEEILSCLHELVPTFQHSTND
ncbi:MAG: polysaccharide biosynthesis protein [Clostridiales bacterium]|jgi:FlaA1/EpsC-like NDP-sugar epimerase|nr:polysaccharide biosynthesis protein [Clostridiales bacterium]